MTTQARKARDAGIRRAVEHAEQGVPDWSAKAGALLDQFILSTTCPFSCEDFRAYAAEKGLPEPPHARAFGGIFKAFAWRGLIYKVGTTQSRAPHCHMSFSSLWEVA